jgi:hypothetical protein
MIFSTTVEIANPSICCGRNPPPAGGKFPVLGADFPVTGKGYHAKSLENMKITQTEAEIAAKKEKFPC